ncbi:MAG TPA: TPM domain-containing protein, partial [Thauera aminoaromatica]|nr:TPM domain-containing protein [Thauera aminoaromatica]
LFGKQRVWDTEDNNGVLVYLLLAEHRIEIVADRALARQLEPAAWQELVDRLATPCREARFEDALAAAVDCLDQLLRAAFPGAGVTGLASGGGLSDRPVLR